MTTITTQQPRTDVTNVTSIGVVSLLELGRRLVEQGSYGDAIRALQRRLRLAPSDHEARYLLGLASLRAGDVQRAAAEFATVAGHERVDAALCYDLAVALQDLGDAVGARRWLRIALAADPRNDAASERLTRIDAALAATGTEGASTGRRPWLRGRRR